MPRRAGSLATLLLLIGLLHAASAQAKSGELDFILITGPDGRQLEVLGGMLNAQLSEGERGNLYWPLLNGTMKGDHRPAGDLGPRYDFAPGGTATWTIVPLWMGIMALLIVVGAAVAVALFFFRRRRRTA